MRACQHAGEEPNAEPSAPGHGRGLKGERHVTQGCMKESRVLHQRRELHLLRLVRFTGTPESTASHARTRRVLQRAVREHSPSTLRALLTVMFVPRCANNIQESPAAGSSAGFGRATASGRKQRGMFRPYASDRTVSSHIRPDRPFIEHGPQS